MKDPNNRKENANHMNLVAMAQNVMGFVLLMGKGFVPKDESEDPYRIIDNTPVYHSAINIFPFEIPSSRPNLFKWGSFIHPYMMMGMPDTNGLVKLYVSFYQENYLLWIYCKLDEEMNGKSDFVSGLIAWTPKVKGDSLQLAGFRLFYALLCQMDFIKDNEDFATSFTTPQDWTEEWEATANCNMVFSALRNTSYLSHKELEKRIEDAPDFLRESIRKRASLIY
jgi:hypothetical protein